jgi:hypothetical protein
MMSTGFVERFAIAFVARTAHDEGMTDLARSLHGPGFGWGLAIYYAVQATRAERRDDERTFRHWIEAHR